jgi:hypothetical protein
MNSGKKKPSFAEASEGVALGNRLRRRVYEDSSFPNVSIGNPQQIIYFGVILIARTGQTLSQAMQKMHDSSLAGAAFFADAG